MSSFIEVLNPSPNKDKEKLRAREIGRGSETKTRLLQKEGGMKGSQTYKSVSLLFVEACSELLQKQLFEHNWKSPI